MSRVGTLRNVAIVLLIAAAVDFLPGGGRAADTFGAVLSVAFIAGMVYFVSRVYREQRITIYGLGDQRRAMLYGAVAVGVFALAAKQRMWLSGFGEFVWFVLLGLAGYTLYAIYRFSRTY
ncbi:MAG TPA: hypothetical protein VLJ42_03845 [Solirubrobacteraceae bacterium]|nr:hypothetical protein [Solirubrobacteraceae bacterium]